MPSSGLPPPKSSPGPGGEELLVREVARCRNDPIRYARMAFPWGMPDTPLEREKGPEPWQNAVWRDVGRACTANAFDGLTPCPPVRVAVSSGHGIGKSAWTAITILWLMSTRPRCKITVTATTAEQLRSRTWAELAKWHALAINTHWFDCSHSRGGLSLRAVCNPEGWFAVGHTCREENSEAFAGQHAADSSSIYIFDEASGVPDKIYEVAEGGLTDGEPFFFALGNPTRRAGVFNQIFGAQRHRWLTHQIDSREVARTNKDLINEWVKDYGEDSDWVRVRVRGVFPRGGDLQFIDSECIHAAMRRQVTKAEIYHAPIVIGADVARYGDDASVICVRQGLGILALKRYRGADLMTVAGLIAQAWQEHKADAVFVDVGGLGAGVVDRLLQQGLNPIAVNFGGTSTTAAYANKRSEMWGRMRDWIRQGGCLPSDNELRTDLEAPLFGVPEASGRITLEHKDHMRKRGVASPDSGDALALTFAELVVRATPYELLQKRIYNNEFDPIGAPTEGLWSGSYSPIGG